jgi:hypothetical protein
MDRASAANGAGAAAVRDRIADPQTTRYAHAWHCAKF